MHRSSRGAQPRYPCAALKNAGKIATVVVDLYIELPHIEAPDVLPVQIHHVPVGDAPLPLGLQEGEPLPPLG